MNTRQALSSKEIADQFHKMTVLVVDATDSMRHTVSTMLISIGFAKVIQAHNGNEALKYLARGKVDLILSEFQLSKMDGIDLLIQVRKEPNTIEIPFIITSATVDHSEVIRAIKCGVSEYIVKPYSPKILEERIIRAISNPVKKFSEISKNKKNTIEENRPIEILVVDDIVDNIEVISNLLKDDYEIRAVTDGEKALKICTSKNPPDMILLDIMMPEMNGLEVCRRLKANPMTEHITIIFLTALDQNKHIVKGFELGAVDYITKPINPPVVKARVNTHAKIIESNKALHLQVDTMIDNERLKQEFDRVMQNDLKQPVNEVFKTIELIKKYAKDAVKVKYYSESIKSSCGYMHQLIDNILLLTELEEGNYHLVAQKIDIAKVLDNVINSFKTSCSEKQLEIHNEIQQKSYVSAEELLTHSILVNLLKNAIEAAPRGSALNIRIDESDNFRIIEIHNQGEIPDEIHDNFFDKYVTGPKKQSSGLGSYAAKLMTDIQKGEIRFESSKLSGTSLFVSLPAPPE